MSEQLFKLVLTGLTRADMQIVDDQLDSWFYDHQFKGKFTKAESLMGREGEEDE